MDGESSGGAGSRKGTREDDVDESVLFELSKADLVKEVLELKTAIKEHRRYKEEAEFQRNILKSTGQSIICTDLTGIIMYWNKAATTIYGWEEEEVMGQNIFVILPAANPIVEEQGLEIFAELSQGKQWKGEFSLCKKNGDVIDVMVTNTPVMDEEGTLVGLIGISTDIMELKKKEQEILRLNAELELRVVERTQQLEESNVRLKKEIQEHLLAKEHLQAYAKDLEASREKILEQSSHLEQVVDELRKSRIEAESANRLKSRFLASMSHEIRTPMNGVIGMTNLILSTDLSDEQKQFVNTIRTSGDSLLAIIDDILDFSKIEAGELLLEHRNVSFTQCLEDAVDLLAVKGLEKGIEMICYVDSTVPEVVQTDPTRLRQVIVNLVSNALKFTEGEGEVVVRASAEPWRGPPPPTHRAFLAEPCHRLHVWVQDTGIGIDKASMDRLFKPFSQVDASTTRRFGGTGLGLIISKQLVEMLGGEMWAESPGPNQGSAFHFTIALYSATATPTGARLALPRPHPPHHHHLHHKGRNGEQGEARSGLQVGNGTTLRKVPEASLGTPRECGRSLHRLSPEPPASHQENCRTFRKVPEGSSCQAPCQVGRCGWPVREGEARLARGLSLLGSRSAAAIMGQEIPAESSSVAQGAGDTGGEGAEGETDKKGRSAKRRSTGGELTWAPGSLRVDSSSASASREAMAASGGEGCAVGASGKMSCDWLASSTAAEAGASRTSPAVNVVHGLGWGASGDRASLQRSVSLAAPSPHLSVDKALFAGKAVLVVDDNASCRQLLASHLSDLGFLPTAAGGASEALRLVEEKTKEGGPMFSVALVDIQMPEMDGLTLARRLKELPGGVSLPIVLLCPYGGANQVHHDGTDVVAVLSKPLRQTHLDQVLANALLPHATDETTTGGGASCEGGGKRKRAMSSLTSAGGLKETGGGGFRAGMAEDHPLTILLVEDNLVNQRVATRMLSRLAYACDVACNGREALEALEKQKYDLVLMDIQMPVMDGIEATQRILERWASDQRPRIVAMTANVLNSDRELCLKAGMDGFISKPIHVQDLISALEQTSILQS